MRSNGSASSNQNIETPSNVGDWIDPVRLGKRQMLDIPPQSDSVREKRTMAFGPITLKLSERGPVCGVAFVLTRGP